MSGRSSNRTVARHTLIVIGLVLATVVALLLIYETRRVLVWIMVAAFFAVALNPAVSWVERRAGWLRRWLATLLVFVVAFALLGGLVALFVTPLVREGSEFVDDLPQAVADARAGRGQIGELLERFNLREYAASHSEQIQQYASRMATPTLAFLRGTATTIAGIVTIIVLAYLMVLQAPRLVAGFLGLFPAERAEHIRRVGGECARTITGYISGNLVISLICGTLTYVVLKIMGVPYAGLIALFVAVADLIPLVGATLGAVAASLAAFAESTTALIVVVIFFIVYQQVENHLLQPIVFARTVRLNALTVLVAILLGVELAGILGALMAIPVAGIVQIVTVDIWRHTWGRPDAAPTSPAVPGSPAPPASPAVPAVPGSPPAPAASPSAPAASPSAPAVELP